MAPSGKYRGFALNPITNEWVDKGWIDADSQDAAIKQMRDAAGGGTFFAVPSSSFHPVAFERVERPGWTRMDYEETDPDASLHGEAVEAPPVETGDGES